MYRYCSLLLLVLMLMVSGCGSGPSGNQDQLVNSLVSGEGLLNGNSSGLLGPGGNVGPGTGTPVAFGPGTRAVALTSVDVSPTSLSLTVGANAALTVTGTTDTSGQVSLPGSTTASVSFEVNNPSLASVNAGGLVTASAVGATQVVITVVNDGVTFTETVDLLVTPGGGNSPLAFILVSNPTPNGSGGSVSSIAVASDGTLSVVDDNSNVNRALAIAATPSGLFGYAGSIFGIGGVGADISVFGVNLGTGLLTFNGPSVPVILGGAQSLTSDPSGNSLYVRDGSAAISAFLIGNDGSLTPNPNVTNFDSGAGGFTLPTFNTPGNRMYLTDINDDSVAVLSVDTVTGALASFGPEIAAGNEPRNSVLGRNGDFLFVSNLDGEVRSFSGAATGNLAQVDVATVDPGPGPMAVHPTLPVLYVAGASDTVQTIPLDISGNLGLPGTPLATGNRPRTVMVDQGGRFAYVLCRGNTPITRAAISAFSIDATTGQLTFLQDYEFSELSFPSAGVIVSSLTP